MKTFEENICLKKKVLWNHMDILLIAVLEQLC